MHISSNIGTDERVINSEANQMSRTRIHRRNLVVRQLAAYTLSRWATVVCHPPRGRTVTDVNPADSNSATRPK